LQHWQAQMSRLRFNDNMQGQVYVDTATVTDKHVLLYNDTDERFENRLIDIDDIDNTTTASWPDGYVSQSSVTQWAPTVQTYSAAISVPGGSGTTSVVWSSQRYAQYGDVVWMQVDVQFTVTTAPAAWVGISLPVAGATGIQHMPCMVFANGVGANTAGYAFLSSGVMRCAHYVNTVFGTGGASAIRLGGTYFAA